MIVSIWLAIFLGFVQGLTEFLPVSSSGHLMMFQHLFNVQGNHLLFTIVLHIATLLAVMVVFRKKIWQLIRHPFNKTNYCLLTATILTCAFVILCKDFIDKTFTYKILPITFMVTAIILFAATMVKPKENEITYKSAIAVGIMQGIAVIPGLSRSGTTISTLLVTGTKRERAAEFSFLMSIPIIIASLVYALAQGSAPAGSYELISNGEKLQLDIFPTAIAFITALASGILAIKFMLHLIRRVKLHWFSMYLVVLAIVCMCIF